MNFLTISVSLAKEVSPTAKWASHCVLHVQTWSNPLVGEVGPAEGQTAAQMVAREIYLMTDKLRQGTETDRPLHQLLEDSGVFSKWKQEAG